MGMFDNIVCEVPLPHEVAKHVTEWQTKSFDHPFLRTYRISAEGRLLAELVHYEDRSDPNAEPGSLASLAGAMTAVRDGWRDMNYHGLVHFYGFPDSGPFKNEWVEYEATFTHGQLEGFKRIGAEAGAPSE